MILAATLAPAGSNLVWGLNTWALFPLPWRLVSAGLALALLWIRVPGAWSGRTATWVALGAAAVWALFPARTVLLGDGISFVHAFGDLAERTPRSPFFAALVGSLLEDLGMTGDRFVTAVGWVSWVSGGLFVGVLAWLWRPRSGWSAAALGVLVGGYLGIFQRYVEAYPPVIPLVAVYLGFLLRPAGPRRSLALLISQVLWVGLHTVGIVLAPVTLWVLLGDRVRGVRRRFGVAVGVLGLGGVLSLVAGRGSGPGGLLDPARAGAFALEQLQQAFVQRPWSWPLGVVHPMQAVEILNGMMLSVAPALLVLAGLSATGTGRKALRGLVLSPFGAAVGLFLGARGLTATGLGPLLDWDLYAVLVLPLAFLGLAALSRTPRSCHEAVGGGALVVGVFLLIPWMGVLHRPTVAVEKLTAYATGSPAPRPYVGAQVYYRLGDEWVRGGKPDRAARSFLAAHTLYPRAVYARAEGQARLKADDRAGALKAFRRAQALDPADPTATEMVALLMGNEDVAASRAAFQGFLEQRPDDPNALFGLALADRAEGRTEAALDGMARAIPGFRRDLEQNPRQEATRRKLVLCLMSLERFGEAGAEARILIDQGVGSAADWLHLGISRLQQGDPSGALEALEQALALDPASEQIRGLRDGLKNQVN